MNSYFIKEMNADVTYIELRLLLLLDCDEKNDKINEILMLLRNHNFIVNLTSLSYGNIISADKYYERDEVMSLTIDMNNDKMRFKFWNGMSTQWLYHVDDVRDALDTGRNNFTELYDKYEPITELIQDFAHKWRNSIYNISYKYKKDNFDIVYHIVFTNDIKQNNSATKILSKLNKELAMLDDDVKQDLNFKIEHSYQPVGCAPCERAKKEREKHESQNDKGQNV